MTSEAHPAGPGTPAADGAVVESEFASVRVSVDHSGNGPRLRVEDLRTGHVGFLDALELETLAWLPPGRLHPLLDPSHVRWRDRDPTGPDDG